MDNTVVIVAKATAQAGKSEELDRELRGLVRATHLEPGVLIYDLHRSATDPDDFLMYEKYESQEALDAHLAGAALQHFLALAPHLVEGDIEIKPYKLVAASD